MSVFLQPTAPTRIEEVRFAPNSPLEGDGFEPSVPLAKRSRFRALITRNALTITPPHFRLGSIHTPPESGEHRDRDFAPAVAVASTTTTSKRPASFGSTPGSSAQRFDAPSGPPVQAVVKCRTPTRDSASYSLPMGPAMPSSRECGRAQRPRKRTGSLPFANAPFDAGRSFVFAARRLVTLRLGERFAFWFPVGFCPESLAYAR